MEDRYKGEKRTYSSLTILRGLSRELYKDFSVGRRLKGMLISNKRKKMNYIHSLAVRCGRRRGLLEGRRFFDNKEIIVQGCVQINLNITTTRTDSGKITTTKSIIYLPSLEAELARDVTKHARLIAA